MKNLVEELRWRGLFHDMMPGTEEQLLKEATTAYIGFDPTADSLHWKFSANYSINALEKIGS